MDATELSTVLPPTNASVTNRDVSTEKSGNTRAITRAAGTAYALDVTVSSVRL